jgi:hypothetical protein
MIQIHDFLQHDIAEFASPQTCPYIVPGQKNARYLIISLRAPI